MRESAKQKRQQSLPKTLKINPEGTCGPILLEMVPFNLCVKYNLNTVHIIRGMAITIEKGMSRSCMRHYVVLLVLSLYLQM